MITSLTKEHEARFPEFVEKWTRIGLSTEPADRPRAEAAIRGLYKLAKLKDPAIIWLPCPISGSLSSVAFFAAMHMLGKKTPAVDSAVRSAVGSAVRSAVDSAVGSAVDSAVDSAVGSAQSAGYAYFGGSLWSGWSAWHDYFNIVCGVPIDRNYHETIESCGYFWLLEGVCFASERPAQINRDAQGRLHSESGNSISYPSGWGLWHVHGVQVPQFVVENPASMTIDSIHAEANAEVQRVMIERYGEDRYIVDSGMKPVAKDEKYGDIYVKEVSAGRPIAKIRVVNRSPEPDGSYRIYWLNFNPAHYGGDAGRIPQAAVASTWRTTPGGRELFFKRWQDYSPVMET